MTVKARKAETVVEADEAIRPDSTVESLAKLPAIGGDDATHTAGNAPGVNDGAAAVVVASDEWAQANGREVARARARLRDGRRRLRLPGQDAGEGRRAGAGARSASPPTTSTSGRSTRRSPRSRSTRCGCSASTRTRSTSTAARSRSATRSAPPARGSSAPSCTSCAAAAAALGCAAICSGGGQGDAIVARGQRRASAMPRAAAFFDLDRTLISGSSGLPWARAATKAGLISRRQMARWGVDAMRFRLRGSTDEATEKLLGEIKQVFNGVSGASDRAHGARGAGRACCRGSTRRCWRRSTPTRTRAGRPSSSAPPATSWSSCSPGSSTWTAASGPATRSARTGAFTGELGGAFMYGEGKVEAMREFAARARHRPRRRPTRTRTRSRTCRCCARSATRWSSIPTTS